MLHNPYSNLPTNSDTVTFQYDASGRRLKKTYTSHIEIDGTPHTDVTTYKYHYAGGAITEIELDKVRDSTTTLLDQELIYHIGANSQPISFEWTRHTGTGESQTTTTSTYYYHYDVHGNTLKVTDTNQDTKITYTYDTLGNITSQTNPDSIPNPFTFMGASQTILDTETNLYFSSGYYNPQTGTLLQGTGSPAMPNPTSISTINSMSTSSLPEEQLLSHSITSATTAGSSSGGEPGSFSPPPGPSDGISHSGRQSGPPSLDFSNPDAELVGAKDVGEKNINGIICTNGSAEDGGDILKRNSEGLGFMFDPPPPKKNDFDEGWVDQSRATLRRLFRQILNGTDFDAAAKLRKKLAEEASKIVILGTPAAEERDFIQSITKATNYFLQIRDKKGNLVAWIDADNLDVVHIMNVDKDGQLVNVMGPPQELSLDQTTVRLRAWLRLIDAFEKGKVTVQINPIPFKGNLFKTGALLFTGESADGRLRFAGFSVNGNGEIQTTTNYCYDAGDELSEKIESFYGDEDNKRRWYKPLIIADTLRRSDSTVANLIRIGDFNVYEKH